MSEPIVFISHSSVKPGKMEELERFTRDTFPQLEADKPRTLMHYAYLDGGGTEVHFVHVFPDAEAMEAHMVGVAERVEQANQLIEIDRFEIYGTPSDEVLSMMQQSMGIEVAVKPLTLGGFIRLGAH